MRDLAITAVVSLLIILGGWRFLSYQNNSTIPQSPVLKTDIEEVTGTSTTIASSTKPVASTTPVVTKPVVTPSSSSELSVSVKNQPAGKAIVIDEVVSSKPVWIAIHADNKGQLGGVLGARLVAGSAKSISVGLLKPAEVGTYYAVLHTDNGNRKYANKEDAVILGSDGKPVLSMFKVY